MKTPCPITLALISVLASSPAAAAGIDLAWDACLGEPAATSAKHFACDVNSGVESLWLSFETEVSVDVRIFEVAFEFRTLSGAPLPAWWNFVAFTGCRPAALGPGLPPLEGTPTCANWATGSVPEFVVNRIDFQFPTADVGRMVLVSRTPGQVTAGQRYLACLLQLSHVRSTGLQTCAGCQEPMRITFTAVNVGGVILTQPITQNSVLWQRDAPTRARASTWAAVKSLYR